MRASIEFEVFGSTVSELLHEAKKTWRDIIDDVDADLPQDSEFSVTPDAANDYKATVFVRIKVENG